MQARKQVLCSQSETGSLHTPSLFQPLFTAQSDDRFVRETRATVLQFLCILKSIVHLRSRRKTILKLRLLQQSIEQRCSALVKFVSSFFQLKLMFFQLFDPDLVRDLGRSRGHRFQGCLVVEVRMFLRHCRHGFSYQPESEGNMTLSD